MTEYEQLLYTLGAKDQSEAMAEIGRLHGIALEKCQRVIDAEAAVNFMRVALRHVEYKRGTGGPTVDEILQGFRFIGIPTLRPNTN